MATAVTKVGPKYQVTIPRAVRNAIGLKVGDVVEASVGPKGSIVLHPKVQLRIEKAEWESLPAAVRKRIQQSQTEVKAGRSIGPFGNKKDLVRSLGGGGGAERVMLPAGTHDLELFSPAFECRAAIQTQINPGGTAT